VGGDGVEEKVGVEFTMKCVNLVLRLRMALGRMCTYSHHEQQHRLPLSPASSSLPPLRDHRCLKLFGVAGRVLAPL
jgi:hypothetical protein